MAWEDGTYNRRAGTVDKGRDFEDGMTALFLLRALRRWPTAKMATNMDVVGAFDDIVLLYPSGNGNNSSALFIQLKHKKEDFCVSQSLLHSGSRDFGIKRYYKRFCDLWDNDELWENINVDINSTKFILYTNAKVSCTRGTPVEADLMNFLNTGPPYCAHYLDADSLPYVEGPLAIEFLRRFILCSEQSHVELLDTLLLQEVVAQSGLLPDLCHALRKYARSVQIENRKIGTISCFHSSFEGYSELQHWIDKRTRLTCNKSTVELTGERIKEQLQQRNVVSIVMNKSSPQLRSCVVAQALKALSLTPVLFADEQSLRDAVKLWRRAPSTLILDEEGLSLESADLDLLKSALSGEHRLLLLAPAEGGAVSQALLASPPLFRDVSIADLSEESREALLATEVRLQGASRTVPFARLAPESVWPSLGADVVSLLLLPGPPLELGHRLQPSPEHYIERELRRRVSININILKDPTVHDIFLIEGMDMHELKNVVHSKDLVGELQEIYYKPNLQYISISEYDNITSKTLYIWKNKSRHYLSYSNNQLIVVDSKGNADNILKYQHEDTNRWSLNKAKFKEIDVPSNTFLRVGLCTDPGMGKSTFLLKRAERIQEEHPHWWVVLVQLRKLCSVLKEIQMDVKDAKCSVQYLLESATISFEQHCASLLSKLLNHAVWTTGECAVLIDGFDEIAPDYTDIVRGMISYLSSSPVRVMWVTTRPVTTQAVKEALGGNIFTLQPLRKDQQMQLMLKIWNMSDQTAKEEALDIIDILSKTANSTKSIPVTGSPLTLYLIAKWLNKRDINTTNIWQGKKTINLFELYEALIKSVFDRFYVEKLGEDTSHPRVASEMKKSKRDLYNTHSLCALKVLLKPEDFIDILPNDDVLNDIIEEVRLGILVEVGEDKPTFVHRSFSEFFAAWWLAKNWENCNELVRRLLCMPGMYIVRQFFHESLVFEHPLHNQIFNKLPIPIDKSFLVKHLNSKDGGKRTPLHIAAFVGDCRMVECLVGLGAKLEDFGGVNNFTPLNYAVHMENWPCVRALTDLGAVVENDVSRTSYIDDLREAGVPIDWGAFEAHWPVVNVPRFIQKEEEEASLLYASAFVGHERCVAWLKEECKVGNLPDNLLENVSGFLQGYFARNPVCSMKSLNENSLKAAESGHLRNLEWALGLGAQINYCGPCGNTALHLTARHGKTVSVAALIRRGANTKARNKDCLTPKDLARTYKHADVEILIENMETNASNDSEFRTGLSLWDAASEGRLERVKELLLQGADTGVRRYPSGATALHEAAAKGFTDIVRLLCESGADCEVKDAEGRHPLHLAAANGHSDVFNILISYGSDWKCATDDKSTPLHFACSIGEVNIIRALLQKGVEVDIKNKYGRSPLHVAAYNGHCAAIKVLLQAGADIFMKDYLDNTPLTAAAQSGHCRALVLLIKEQILIFGEVVDYNDTVEAALESRRIDTAEILLALQDSKNENKVFELLEASVMGDVRKVQNMLKVHGNALFFHKCIPAAAFVAASNSHPEVIELLCDAGFDVGIRNNQHCSILHFAATQSEPAIVEMLLNRGADLNAKTTNGLTPLMLAVVQGHDAVAVALIEVGAEVEDPDQLLRVAARCGACDVVKKLLDGGVNCNAVGIRFTFPSSFYRDYFGNEDEGMRPLHLAAEKGHQKIVSTLLEKGARIDAVDENGETALHKAKRYTHTEVVFLLLKAGANPKIRNREGQSAYDLTLKRKWKNLTDLTWF